MDESLPNARPQSRDGWLARTWVWILTIAWIGVLLVVIWCRRDEFQGLQLNALGDFLAGAAAPLAFLWLVRGYFLQSRELGLQREQLALQRNELANLVAAQDRHASEAAAQRAILERQDARASKLSQPSLILSPAGGSGGPGGTVKKFKLKNCGGPAFRVVARCTSASFVGTASADSLDSEDEMVLAVRGQGSMTEWPDVEVSYQDSGGLQVRECFRWRDGFYVSGEEP